MSFDKLYLGGNITDLDLGKTFEKYIEVVFNFEDEYGEQKTVLYSTADDWMPNHNYSVNDIVAYETSFYTCKTAHTSGSSFDSSKWDEKKTDAQVLEITMPVLTDSVYAQQIAQNVLTALNQGQHRPYTAREAVLDPAFQLGDGVTMTDFYSIIGTATEVCDALYTVGISAKGRDETEDEFVYKPTTEKNLQRQITKTRSSFKIGIDGIEALVTGLAPDWAPGTQYQVRDLVKRNGVYYTCTTAHTSGSSFDSSKWSEGTDQATLQNSIKLNIADGLVLSSDAGSDENSCYIQLKYGNITLFAQDIYMNKVRADSLSAQTINAEDVDIAGTLEFYGSLNHPGFESNHNYNSGDIILATARATDWSGLSEDITGLWECTTAHNSSEFSFTMDYSLGRWTYYGPEGTPQLGGYMGFGSGNDGTSQPTKGVVMASSKKNDYGSGDHYIITTSSGVRLQSGSTALYLAGGHIKYSVDGTNFQDLGYAVFS